MSRNVIGFFRLSPSESSVFQVCTEKITVYQIKLLKVQKNWFVILFQVDSTYISNSISQMGNSFAFHLTSLISLVDYQLLDFLFFPKKWDQLFRNFTFKARLDLSFFGQFSVEDRVKFWGNLRKLFYLPLSIKMRCFCIHVMNDFELLWCLWRACKFTSPLTLKGSSNFELRG